MNFIGKYLEGLADLMLPRECIVCGRRLGIQENHLCIYCMADFPFTFFWNFEKNPMAEAFNALISEEMERSGDCSYEAYSRAAALFFYRSGAGYRQIAYRLKYHGDTSAGKYFGHLLGEKIAASPLFGDIDLIVPIPLHPLRLLKRGYNQAEIIASAIANATGAKLCTNLLYRRRRTQTQTKLDKEAKRENVRNAFAVREKTASRLKPKHIAIVDDVFTTGATMHSCHRALRRQFGQDVRISAITLGYVSSY